MLYRVNVYHASINQIELVQVFSSVDGAEREVWNWRFLGRVATWGTYDPAGSRAGMIGGNEQFVLRFVDTGEIYLPCGKWQPVQYCGTAAVEAEWHGKRLGRVLEAISVSDLISSTQPA